jgi:hypothetical protein
VNVSQLNVRREKFDDDNDDDDDDDDNDNDNNNNNNNNNNNKVHALFEQAYIQIITGE